MRNPFRNKPKLSRASIKESCDNLPTGLCFAYANGLPILVFDLAAPENIARAVAGETVGTLVKE